MTVAGQRVGQAAAHAVDERGAQQERRAGAAAGDRAPRRAGSRRPRGRRPRTRRRSAPGRRGPGGSGRRAASPAPQPSVRACSAATSSRRELEPVRAQQLVALLRGEREVGRADLDEPPAHAQHVQRHARVAARRQHDAAACPARAARRNASCVVAVAVAQHVHVVEHEHDRCGSSASALTSSGMKRVARIAHGRGQRGQRGVRRRGAGERERGQHRLPQAAGIVVGGLERDPGDRPVGPADLGWPRARSCRCPPGAQTSVTGSSRPRWTVRPAADDRPSRTAAAERRIGSPRRRSTERRGAHRLIAPIMTATCPLAACQGAHPKRLVQGLSSVGFRIEQ